MAMNDKMKTKYVCALCNSFLKIELNCDYDNYVILKLIDKISS